MRLVDHPRDFAARHAHAETDLTLGPGHARVRHQVRIGEAVHVRAVAEAGQAGAARNGREIRRRRAAALAVGYGQAARVAAEGHQLRPDPARLTVHGHGQPVARAVAARRHQPGPARQQRDDAVGGARPGAEVRRAVSLARNTLTGRHRSRCPAAAIAAAARRAGHRQRREIRAAQVEQLRRDPALRAAGNLHLRPGPACRVGAVRAANQGHHVAFGQAGNRRITRAGAGAHIRRLGGHGGGPTLGIGWRGPQRTGGQRHQHDQAHPPYRKRSSSHDLFSHSLFQ